MENASSPNSSTSSSSSSSNGASLPPKLPPLSSATASATAAAGGGGAPATTPKSASRPIDPNPYPTTFIQADSSSFKQVVQMLTGSAVTAAAAAASGGPKSSIPPAGKPTGPKKPAFKLYERRESMKNLKMINPMIPSFAARSNPNSPAAASFSPRKMLPEMLSPSMLDLPSLALSPVTPLIADPFEALKAEQRAIAEKGFYFLPSPRRTTGPPRLLPLFPVSSSEVFYTSSN